MWARACVCVCANKIQMAKRKRTSPKCKFPMEIQFYSINVNALEQDSARFQTNFGIESYCYVICVEHFLHLRIVVWERTSTTTTTNIQIIAQFELQSQYERYVIAMEWINSCEERREAKLIVQFNIGLES